MGFQICLLTFRFTIYLSWSNTAAHLLCKRQLCPCLLLSWNYILRTPWDVQRDEIITMQSAAFLNAGILRIIRPAAHSWPGRDHADLRIRQTTSLRREIPANHD